MQKQDMYSWKELRHKVAVTHNESNESIATVKKRACLFHWIDHTALKYFNKLQSHSAKNGSDLSHCNETCEVFDCKSLKLGRRYLIFTICMLLFACRIFSANNYSGL